MQVRGEREFLVSSDMKLKDFKVKVRYLASCLCGAQMLTENSNRKSNLAFLADGGVQSSYL